MKVFSIYDSKVEAFMAPFFSHTTGSGIRSFEDLVKNGDARNQIALHPEDYSLFEIAEWDENRGVLSPYEAHKHLMTALEMTHGDSSATA